MYVPPAFAETDKGKLYDFIEAHAFGLLVSTHGGEPFATHLPFLLERDAGPHGRLVGHLARANLQWQGLDGRPVLAVFSGPHAYVSPSWYEADDVVPTWMNVFDVGLSTQTDDPVGWGRTTAKLPEYLACGAAVVCSDVGEAHRWLASSGQTLPYEGLRDPAYPARLAARLQAIRGQDLRPLRVQNRALALRLFDYRILRGQIREFLSS